MRAEGSEELEAERSASWPTPEALQAEDKPASQGTTFDDLLREKGSPGPASVSLCVQEEAFPL